MTRIEKGISSRKRAPSLCMRAHFSQRDARVPRLYVAHALCGHNATREETFQNTSAVRQGQFTGVWMKRSARFCRIVVCLVASVVLASWYCQPLRAAQKGAKHGSRAARVQTGLDVLESQKFAPL